MSLRGPIPAALAALCAALCSVGLCAPAPARAQDESIETLHDAIREIRRLQARVEELEARGPLDPGGEPHPRPAAAEPPLFTLDAYGFLRLDAVRDDTRPNDPQIMGYVRPGSDPGDGDSSFSLYPRLSRIGVNLNGPRIERLGGARSSGRVEVDFYGFPASDSRNLFRMRHAWLALEGDRWRILAGQSSDLISPLYPAVNADLVMWGAGNLGDRRPQLRGDYRFPLAEGHSLLAQGAIGLSDAISGANRDGDSLLDGEASGRPTYQGRLAYSAAVPWADASMELGIWGHRAWEEVDVAVAGVSSFDSRAVGADWSLPLLGRDLWLKGEVWSGENLADVRGGIFQGVNPNTGDEIEADGGWVELGWRALESNVLSVGYSWDDPDNADLTPGDASVNRSANRIFYLSTVDRRFFPLTLGLEYLRWTTHFVGDSDATDNRIKGFVSLSF